MGSLLIMTGPRRHLRGPAGRLARALVIVLLLAGAVTGIRPNAAPAAVSALAPAVTCGAWSGPQPPSPGTEDNNLNGVAVHTVEVHLAHAYAKLGVHSRAQLASRLASPAPPQDTN